MARPDNAKTLGPGALAKLAPPLRPAGAGGPVRVVVLGGGFAGVHTAKRLSERLGARKDVEVELLAEENYFVFQPLLPEVAAGGLAPTHVVNPIREMVPKARFRCCKILDVDTENRRVLVTQGDGTEIVAVHYDHLVFALGKVGSFATMRGATEHALAMKDLGDAFRLRNHVLRCLEAADVETDEAKRRELLCFVVAGGGFSGVETMGELEELVSRSLRYFPRVARADVSYRLVHSQARLLPEMPERLGISAREVLERRGVEVILGARVSAVTPSRVYLADGRAIATRSFVCTVGSATNPIARHAMDRLGFVEGKLDGRATGALLVDRHLACIDRPKHWAVGDCAAVPSADEKGFCPPTAQLAIREAACCADNILATIAGKPLRPFDFKPLGMLASLGKRSAVAWIFGLHLTGFLAWFLWRTVYLAKLPGAVRRLRVTIDWTLDLFFPRDITHLQTARPKRLEERHHEPAEIVVRKGEVGRELYVVIAGELEVLDEGGTVVATLGPRDVFGEIALLEETRRTATVRAKTGADVLVLPRGDFHLLRRQLPVLDELVASVAARRTSAREASPPPS